MSKKGRFEYDYNTDCWVCVSCGHRIPNEHMQMLRLIPYCPNCDFRPITYKNLNEVKDNG